MHDPRALVIQRINTRYDPIFDGGWSFGVLEFS